MGQRAAILAEDGTTVEKVIIVASAEDAPTFNAIACNSAIASGWTYVEGTFVAPPPPVPVPKTLEDVAMARLDRLSAGFDYDFGDARGVHTIATSRADMAGWDEVSTFASAAINKGQGNSTINIVTETGATTVTADEWQDILMAAHAWRQVVWSKSFEIAAMDPIPQDLFSNNDLWTV